jgi:prepilin-type N-terminal cleavage/methylation domain-containing protein
MFCHQAAEMIRGQRGRQGFTLIEVMIAMAIFSVGILAVGALQINSANTNTGARIYTEESTWVADQIERLTALDYDNADLIAGVHEVVQGPYTVQWTVTDDAPVAGAKRIAVTATGAHRRARTITIEFIKAR